MSLAVVWSYAQAGIGLENQITKARLLYEQDTAAGVTALKINPFLPTEPGGASIEFYYGPDSRADRLNLNSNQVGTGLRLSATESFKLGNQSFRAKLSVGNESNRDSADVLTGTSFAWQFDPNAEIYVGNEQRHWGPGWVGSLILDQSAPAFWSTGIRKNTTTRSENKWLAWVGPWAADVFFGGPLEGHTKPADPYLVGMRLLLQPMRSLEIGLSRVLQWGGEGRDESLSSLWRGLKGDDNTQVGGLTSEQQPGNQLAGWDVRYSMPVDKTETVAMYLQRIGEDEGGGLPSKNFNLAGVEFAQNSGPMPWRGFLEYTRTKAGRPGVAYRHSVYKQGYTNRNFSLGHPIGGDIELYSLGVVASAGKSAALLAIHSGQTLQGSQFYTPYGDISGAQIGLMYREKNTETGVNVSHFKAPGVSETGVQLFVRLRL